MEVKIKGRSPLWYWVLFIGGNAIFIHQLIFNRNDLQSLLLGLGAVNLVFLPIIVRNVVVIDDKMVCLKMGFWKEKMKISSIKEIKTKPSKIFKNSARHEKMFLQGKGKEVMIISVKDKDKFISELKKRKKEIKVMKVVK